MLKYLLSILTFFTIDTSCQLANNFPVINLFYLNASSGEIVGKSESVLDFSIARKARDISPVSFVLLCEHNQPIRWILNEDFVRTIV